MDWCRTTSASACSIGWEIAEVDITARLNQLDELVRDAKAMPLSASVLVNRDEVLELVEAMQESLPDEIKQARWIVKDREDLLAKAKADGERIVANAHDEQLKMARQEQIVARAHQEAERILAETEEQTRAMRREAEEYVDAKLAQFEIALRRILDDSQSASRGLAKTLDQVEVGREKLRTPGTAAEQEFGNHHDRRPETELFDEEGEGR
jgi:F0F1-type ATP synthase membrane subunit b/b'